MSLEVFVFFIPPESGSELIEGVLGKTPMDEELGEDEDDDDLGVDNRQDIKMKRV